MKPIDFIGLKNFRVFNDQDGIFEELSSINLLTGTNNSGKSSIIKYPQMLKNSVAGNKIPFDLDLTEQEHLLGDFENVLNNTGNRNIEISLPFTFLGITTIYSTFSFDVPSHNDSYKGHLRKMTITDRKDDTDLFSFTYRKATKAEINSHLRKHQRLIQRNQQKKQAAAQQAPENSFLSLLYMSPPYSPLVAYIEWNINVEKLRAYLIYLVDLYEYYLKNKSGENFLEWLDSAVEKNSIIASFLIKSLNSDELLSSWKDFLESDFKTGMQLKGKEPLQENHFDSEDYFIPNPEIEEVFYYYSIDILNRKIKWKNNVDPDNNYFVISECFKSSYKELIWRISTINYLSTVKGENSRIYIGTNNSTFTKLLKDYSSLDIDTTFINKYLKAFEIGDEIKVSFERKHQVINISIISQYFPARDLVDFGYGIKQLILILMHIGVVAEKNRRSKPITTDQGEYSQKDYYSSSLLLIEEPETNLHPKWQSLLAKMFVDANKLYNIQLVIETHSEYLIRKFQTLTAQGKINSKDVKIFYLRGTQKIKEDRKQLETIFIESDGTIDYNLFDGGFFDESEKLEFSLLNIQRDHFLNDFENLKENKQEDEKKIIELQQKIETYTAKIDLSLYQEMVNTMFDTSKLLPHSVIYLTSGQYLLYNTNEHTDFSPVIIQYARSVENELCSVFKNVDSNKSWMMGVMQGSLEMYKFSTTSMVRCSNLELPLLQIEMSAIFNTPSDLKIELLDYLREKRNDAAHPGSAKTKADAVDYITKVNDFLTKWIELKK